MDPSAINAEILTKIRLYYPTFENLTDQELWTAFVNSWNLLMSRLCWSDRSGGSLLIQERTMTEAISPVDCKVIEFYLKHSAVTSIEGAEIVMYKKDGKETLVLENIEDYYIPELNIIRYFLSNQDSYNVCRCEQAIFNIRYMAGYQAIPEEMYTVIGIIIGNSLCKLNNCTDTECSNTDAMAMNAVLKAREIDGERWEYSIPNNIVQDSFDQGERAGIMSALGDYSNCINTLTFNAGAYPG